MTLSEFQNVPIGRCPDCQGTVYWDEDNNRFRYTCHFDCEGEIERDSLPAWLRSELE